METLRVHYTNKPPEPGRKARALCGHWSTNITTDSAAVTCIRCSTLLKQAKTGPMKISTILPFALIIIAAACDTPNDPTGTSSGGDSSTSDSPTSDALEESSTGDSTTGEGSTGDTSGSGGEGMGSGGVEACWADECGEDMPCGKNLACLPHPLNGARVCASSNCFEGPCDGRPLACAETAPLGVCIVNETKHGWCYPQVCAEVGDCAVGSACVNGYCY